MVRRIVLTACAGALLVATAATAYVPTTGTVDRVDDAANVIVLTDGRMFQVGPDTKILLDMEETDWTTVAPGIEIGLVSATPVALRDGQYVVLEPGDTIAPASSDRPNPGPSQDRG